MGTPLDPVRLQRILEQFEIVRTAFLEDPETPPITVSYQANEAGEPQFYHQDCAILVREDQADFARNTLGADGGDGPGMRLMTLPEPGARDAIEAIRTAADNDPDAAAYNHILSITGGPVYFASRGGGNLCNADEPDLPADPSPTPSSGQGSGAGDGVRVRIIDTGTSSCRSTRWSASQTTLRTNRRQPCPRQGSSR